MEVISVTSKNSKYFFLYLGNKKSVNLVISPQDGMENDIKNNNQNLSFKLKTMKNIERKSLETLKNKGISLIIN